MKSAIITLLCLLGVVRADLKSPGKIADRRGGDGRSASVTSICFETRESAVEGRSNSLDEIVISDDFESTVSGSLPAGWLRLDQDRGFSDFFNRRSTWLVYDYGSQNAHSGHHVLMSHFNNAPDANNDYLILPQQYLSGEITLTYWISAQDPEYSENYEVRVSTTDPQPFAFTTLVHSATNLPATWTEQSLNLSAYSGVPFWIAFRHTSYDRFVLKLDDLVLQGTPLPTAAIRGVIINDARRSYGTVGTLVLLRGQFLRTTVAAAGGRYVLGGLPSGNYDLEYYYIQYAPTAANGITVTAPDTTVRDVYITGAQGNSLLLVTQSNPLVIRDFDTTRMIMDIDTALLIHDLSVAVSLNHTYVGDLQIWLRGSYGQTVELLSRDALAGGDDLVNCHFNDGAPLPVAAGSPPYTSLWRPEQELSVFRGAKTFGRWTLLVYDGGGGDQGQLLGYSLYATVGSELAPPAASVALELAPNYPNPFNSTTHLPFELSEPGTTHLTVHNLSGQIVATLVEGEFIPGRHEARFDASGLPSGVYVAALTQGSARSVRKIVLLR